MSVCLITDGRVLPVADLPARIQAAVEAGVSLVQIREKGMDGASLTRLSRRILAAVRNAGRPARVMVNGRLDVAWAAGADGVHLPGGGLPVREVRRLAPPPFVIGVSAHRPEELSRAEAEGADYAIYGPAFPTASHPGAPGIGRDGLAAALGASRLPLWAVGGVTPATARDLAGLPLAGVAAIRALLLASDVAAAVRALAGVSTSRS
jgi:thiamine-phosphate pyrophosphorylase